MTPRLIGTPPPRVAVLIAVAVFAGSTAMGQSSGAPTETAARALGNGSVSPGIPSLRIDQVQPLQQAPNMPQGQSSSSALQIRDVAYAEADTQVTVLEDTLIRVMTDEPLSSRESKEGTQVSFTLSEDVVADNAIVIPRGATVHGEIIQAKKAGALTGSAELLLKLVSLELGGCTYTLYTYPIEVKGTSKTKPTENKVKGGTVIGAIVGGAFSGSAKGETSAGGKLAGMGTGAALGAGVGAMASVATPGPMLTLPAESQMDFHLASPISVRTVSAKEAARLSQGLRLGGPVLYVRGDTP